MKAKACPKGCSYSRRMDQPYPRACMVCGKPEKKARTKPTRTPGYLASNAALTKYGDCDALRKLAGSAHVLGVLIHVEGIPFGRAPGKMQGKNDV